MLTVTLVTEQCSLTECSDVMSFHCCYQDTGGEAGDAHAHYCPLMLLRSQGQLVATAGP